jgi:hypothetical protein
MFSHYSFEVSKELNLVKSPEQPNSTKKTELYHGLKEHPIWKMPEYWEAAILESIQ